MVEIVREQGTSGQDRLARLEAEIGAVKRTSGTAGREKALTRLSALGMLVGIALAIYAYVMSHGTTNALTQNDAITVGIAGMTIGVVSAVSWLRFSLGTILRFWLARLVLEAETKPD